MRTISFRTTAAGAFGLALATLVAACGGGDDDSGPDPELQAPGGATAEVEGFNNRGSETVSEGQVQVEAADFYFSPTFLRGEPGQRVRVEVSNSSGTLHNISFAGGPDMDVTAGEDVEVTVSFPTSGVLTFFCKYHAPAGMRGQLLAGGAEPQAATDATQSTPPADSYGY